MRMFAIAAALVFAAFVTVKGVPTLRHDWDWPVDATAIPSFFNESIGGWLPTGFGTLGTHPTTYLIALPIVLAMWLFGPLAALALLAGSAGFLCARAGAALSQRWSASRTAAIGIGAFALFNPWVYNEVVAGHLVMVLAYGATIALFEEMLRGREASSVRLALWLALAESQLQFFIVDAFALAIFASATKKWLPPIAGIAFALPTIVGVIAERGTIVQTPYILEWQTNQSVAPGLLAALGGYFPGYADRLGPAASVAVWVVLALALAGVAAARRSRGIWVAAAAAAVLFCIVPGVRGPLAIPYAWTVRSIPESGVFRELYDLAGVFAALLAVLACAGANALRPLRYVALAAGAVLPLAWLLAPPSGFWVAASAYPHPAIAAPPFTRVALLPAFQPLQLRDGRGNGADPDVHGYPGRVSAVNEYLPAFPVDVALASYEQRSDASGLRALGVAEVVPRPWMTSHSNGLIGLAAASLTPVAQPKATESLRYLQRPTPLISTCPTAPVVALADRLGACSIFFGDAGPGFAPVRALRAASTSIDPRTDWIDARLVFAVRPAIAQGIGGALTQSRVPFRIDPGSPLLAYVRGRLDASDGRTLLTSPGELQWLSLPPDVSAVTCEGLCELVAQTRSLPDLPANALPQQASPLPFREILPWLFVVNGDSRHARLLRLNERYDAAWIAVAALHVLPHVRIDTAANGWLVGDGPATTIILVQVTSFLQIVAELCGIVCVAWLLKALAREPTKRAP